MFNTETHNSAWHHIQRANKYDAFDEYCELLKKHMPEFSETEDDLRLVFYIGMRLQKSFYAHALTYFEDWKHERTERQHYRQSVFLYAWNTTIPERDTERKAYMLELFCATMGISTADAEAMRTAYEATL